MCPDGFEQPLVVEPVDVFEGGVLDVVEVVPWSSGSDQCSVLYRPMTDSAKALSYESPTDPTDGEMPASAKRVL